MGEKHVVRFEPVGIEIEVDEEQTVLRAAAEQGITLMHGCKEGQCASCKSFVLDGEDIELDKYSTFALPDFELDEGFTLLCRAHVYEDVTIELLNYDEEMIRSGHPIQEAVAEVVSNEHVTHDMRHLVLKLVEPTRDRLLARPVRRHRDPGHGRDPVVLDGQHVQQGERTARVRDPVYPGRPVLGLPRHRLAVGDRLDVVGPVRRLHAARRARLRPGLRRGRRGDGADPVGPAVPGGEGQHPQDDLLLRRAHASRTCASRRSSYALERARSPNFRYVPALSEADDDEPWDGRGRPDHRRRARSTRATSPGPTPTSADRRRWSRRPWTCSTTLGRPREEHLLRQVHHHRRPDRTT